MKMRIWLYGTFGGKRERNKENFLKKAEKEGVNGDVVSWVLCFAEDRKGKITRCIRLKNEPRMEKRGVYFLSQNCPTKKWERSGHPPSN